MTKDQKIILGVIAGMLALMAFTYNWGEVDRYPAQRIILTADGCGYAKSIGFPVKQENSQCLVVLRYRGFVFGSGGVAILDNDRKVTITQSMMLLSEPADIELPLTPGQQVRMRLSWYFLGAALFIGAVTFFYWRRDRRKNGCS